MTMFTRVYKYTIMHNYVYICVVIEKWPPRQGAQEQRGIIFWDGISSNYFVYLFFSASSCKEKKSICLFFQNKNTPFKKNSKGEKTNHDITSTDFFNSSCRFFSISLLLFFFKLIIIIPGQWLQFHVPYFSFQVQIAP